MSTTPMPHPRIDYPKAVWESASSMSESAQSAAMRRVRELGFDEAQGEIPLEETLINLSSVRDVLLETVEKGRLTQLPLRLQSRLLQETNRITQALVDITNGKDAIRVLEGSVEELNATIYQLNLQNQSETVLGLERKINELKSLEVIVKRSMSRASRLEKRLDDVEELMNKLGTLEANAGNHLTFINDAAVKVDGLHETVTHLEAQAKAAMTDIRDHQEAIAQSATSSSQSAAELAEMRDVSQADRAEISALKNEYSVLALQMTTLKDETSEAVTGRLEALDETTNDFAEQISVAKTEFSSKIEDDLGEALATHTEKVDGAINTAESRVSKFLRAAQEEEEERGSRAKEQLKESVAAFQAETEAMRDANEKLIDRHEVETNDLISRLKKLEDQIDGAILRATGYTLFHSFQKRQEDLKKSSRVWAIALGVCALLSVVAAVLFLVYLPYFPSTGPAIYFKITLSLPFVAALSFCGWQYTRERRLEEEYAFKSNISISLKPYQELVEGLVDKEDPAERAKYTAFIISSINKVFTSPTGLVFDTESMPGDEAKALLKATLEGARDIIKAKSGT